MATTKRMTCRFKKENCRTCKFANVRKLKKGESCCSCPNVSIKNGTCEQYQRKTKKDKGG